MAPVQEALPGVPAVKHVALTTADPALALIERFAADKDFDVAKLQALMEMRKDEIRRVAEQEFNVSFAKMQPRIPTIGERARTDKGTYAPREDIVEAIRPILAEFGFSLSFRTEWPDKDRICIVGILTHEGGHSRESQFLTASDQSGSKNAVQALGSAVEYGRRYTTTDLLNIATRRADDDGRLSEVAKAPEGFADWLDDMEALVAGGCTRDELQQAWNGSKDEFRKHAAKAERTRVETWKKKAAKKS